MVHFKRWYKLVTATVIYSTTRSITVGTNIPLQAMQLRFEVLVSWRVGGSSHGTKFIRLKCPVHDMICPVQLTVNDFYTRFTSKQIFSKIISLTKTDSTL